MFITLILQYQTKLLMMTLHYGILNSDQVTYRYYRFRVYQIQSAIKIAYLAIGLRTEFELVLPRYSACI